jgi:DNA-binding transcriptional LysR family regulator
MEGFTLCMAKVISHKPASLYPEIERSMGERDRWVDLLREGVDCALRWGEPTAVWWHAVLLF